ARPPWASRSARAPAGRARRARAQAGWRRRRRATWSRGSRGGRRPTLAAWIRSFGGSRRPEIEEARSRARQRRQPLDGRVQRARFRSGLGVIGRLVLARSLVDDDLGLVHADRAARGGQRVRYVADGVHEAAVEGL